jgi:RNA-directed DNA polymerase
VPEKPLPIRKKALLKRYPLHQCALYHVGSKNRLSEILHSDLPTLLRLSKDSGNFNVFEIPEKICEFTGKRTKARWVQNPLPQLKTLHSRIQHLLSRVIVPDYCHGGTKGKSYRSNAAAHKDAVAVATFDLKSFFASTSSKQVFGFFRHDLQCAPDVAGLLTDLCTYKRALATGSPVSPILAFWANRNLFATLSKRADEQSLTTSIYVDDITISSPRLPLKLAAQVEGIVQKHGHRLSISKTRRFGIGTPKRVTGVVLYNGEMKVPHARFFKARALAKAIGNSSDDAQKELLTARLGGLLGEAAYIDKSYAPWARRIYDALARIRARRRAESQ